MLGERDNDLAEICRARYHIWFLEGDKKKPGFTIPTEVTHCSTPEDVEAVRRGQLGNPGITSRE